MSQLTWCRSRTRHPLRRTRYSGPLTWVVIWQIMLRRVASSTFWWRGRLILSLGGTRLTIRLRRSKIEVKIHHDLDHWWRMKSHGISNPPRFYKTPQVSVPKLPSPSAATRQPRMTNGFVLAVLCILAICTILASARSSTRPSSICAACEISPLTSSNDKALPSCCRIACSRVCWLWWPLVSSESTVCSSCARCLSLLRSWLAQLHWSLKMVWSAKDPTIHAPMKLKPVTWSLQCASSIRLTKRKKRRSDRGELTE